MSGHSSSSPSYLSSDEEEVKQEEKVSESGKTSEMRNSFEHYRGSVQINSDSLEQTFSEDANSMDHSRQERLTSNEIKSLEETVDSLTSQLVSALESNEELKTDKKDLGYTCAKCGKEIEKEATVVGEDHFHPNCFTCEACNKSFGTERYFVIDGKNYCEKDRDTFLDKCCKCDKVIIGDIIRPKETGYPFHPSCFTCTKCENPIQGKYYDKDGLITCEADYMESREKCGKCRTPIVGTILKALDSSFHPSCFTCSKCPLCLDGIKFFMSGNNDQPLCETCYARHSAKKCDECQEAIVEDCLVSKTTGGYFHKQCFNKPNSAIDR